MTYSEVKFTLAPITQEREDLSLLQRTMKNDFPPSERMPFSMLKKQLKTKATQGYFLTDGTEKFGYLIARLLQKERIIYVQYLAVFSHIRSKGYGSILLRLMAEMLPEYTMILEVEHPEHAKDEAEREARERRIRFYNQNGFSVVPSVQIRVFGNVMLMMSSKPVMISDWNTFIKSFFLDAKGSLVMRAFLKVFVKVITQ
ncbi:MAG: GNAT family N-acetyltransferase [Clostridiales bacterium]|nr:GNAT family N-acetyltransferase [Clostridiales bacterium]